VGGAIGNLIEFITWNNSLTSNQHNAPSPFYASKIRDNIVDNSHSIFSVNLITPYISLYIPLTQSFNISEIQSFVLYNRNNNASDQLRLKDFQIELYNRSNGFIPGENILYTMPINTSSPVYRYDLPSISTYTLGFSDIDSQTLIKNISVSDSNFINTVLKAEGGNVEIKGNLTITGNLVVKDIKQGQIVGFRAVTSQNTDLTIGINVVIPFNSVSVNIFAYDTKSCFNTTTSTYTIPTGYSGYWNFNVSLFISEYAETFRRVHLRVTRSGSTFEPLQVGNYNTQINCLSGNIPVLEGDIIGIYVSNGGSIRIYASRDNCWFEGRYIGSS
jgi:hypothetical protein